MLLDSSNPVWAALQLGLDVSPMNTSFPLGLRLKKSNKNKTTKMENMKLQS